MRFEIVIFLAAIFVMANIYHDGKYMKLALSGKKYYQMAGIAFAAYMLCWVMRKNPERAKTMLVQSNEYLKYLPIDKNVSNFILDMTAKHAHSAQHDFDGGMLPTPTPLVRGGGATKRSVSETKKKFVAARQNWHCVDCQKQLPAWFEVDHTVRLESGGSNHVDNLTAMCRDCHGKKTAIENL